MHFVLGDEDRVVGPGTLVHIPRNVRHRSRAVNGPSTFLTVKSPAHDGNLHKDRIVHSEAETAKVEALYREVTHVSARAACAALHRFYEVSPAFDDSQGSGAGIVYVRWAADAKPVADAHWLPAVGR